MTPFWYPSLPQDLRRGRGPRIEILSPSPESLGLRELRIAFQSRIAKGALQRSVQAGPFEAKVRVTFLRPIPVETRTLVLPIRVGPSPSSVQAELSLRMSELAGG